MKRFYLFNYLNNEQKKKFAKLDDKKLYEVTEDLQGGCFGMDRQYTIKEWVEQAFEWLDSSDSFPCDYPFINKLLEGGEQALDEISEFWEIVIEPVRA